MLKRKIIIDTDPGHDDALAIILMERSALFDIQAVTTVAGNSTIQNTTDNARYVLDLIGSTTPLYSGSAVPLKRELIQAEVHGVTGLAGAEITKREMLTENAVEKIVEIIQSNPGEVTILALGPLTNIAKILLKDSNVSNLIQQIVIMGGAIATPGNKNRVAEFNIFVDPDAADIVFRSDTEKVLIPLDACNDVFLTLEDFNELNGAGIYGPIQSMMKHYIEGIRKYEKTSGALMYDPLAAYYLINPGAFKTAMMDLQIEARSELTRGMTVADRRIWGEKSPNVRVAMSADRDAFRQDFLEILGREK
ncbi:MAG TPA: nucleoside hydrolase [Candidatus Paceibacterota bacterium]|nr:nucleoside hydrolase [Candidatus Paceibacterota bacterium]